MNRSTQATSARDRLLAAADELFYRHGISSTGVDAVIARAEVATGSLYNNFAGKDDLVAAYLDSRDHRWRTQWESCIAEQSAPVDRVLAIFTAMELWNRTGMQSRGCADQAAAVQLPRTSAGAAAAVAHKRHLRQRLQELVAATGVPDPVPVSQDILVVYEGMLSLLAMDLDPDPVRRAACLAATILHQAVPAGTEPAVPTSG